MLQEMNESQQLLRAYAVEGSDRAFTELVIRYAGLVHGTAARLTTSHPELTEDVVQDVFIRLAKKARSLPLDTQLGGWLHKQTCHLAANMLRSERRRRSRELNALEMKTQAQESRERLDRAAAHLDDAILTLRLEDQQAVFLRFFEELDFRAVGDSLGCQEDAARMRVNRALEKLRGILTARGHAVSTAGIGAMLTASLTAAPSGLALRAAEAALAAAAAQAGISTGLLKLIPMTSMKSVLVGTVVVLATTLPWYFHHRAESRLRQENQSLREEMRGLSGKLSDATRTPFNPAPSLALSPEQHRELLRLRGEVGLLRHELQRSTNRSIASHESKPGVQESSQDELTPEQEKDVTKLKDAHELLIQLLTHAQRDHGRLPAEADQPAALRDLQEPGSGVSPGNRFELVFKGVIESVSNPAQTLLIRESEPWQSADRNYWRRTYGFVDGHSEIHREPTLEALQAWEEKHIRPAASEGSASK